MKPQKNGGIFFFVFLCAEMFLCKTMLKARYIILTFTISVFGVWFARAQSGVIVVPDSKGMYESFFALSDSTMRREIGSFTFTGSIVGLTGKEPLREFEVLTQTENTITLFLDDIKVHIARGPFIRSGRRFNYHGPYGYVYKIDGRNFWGYDGSIPERQIYSIDVFYGQQRIQLPHSSYRDIYEPNFCFRRRLFDPVECHTRAFLSMDGERIYIYMLNSRIPSLYEVCWIITNGAFTGRVVDYAY